MAEQPLKHESDRAREMRERYAAMGADKDAGLPRSLSRLAKLVLDEQQAAYETWVANVSAARAILATGVTGEYAEAARAAVKRERPKVQSFGVIERRLKEWSRQFGWTAYASSEDQRRFTEAQRGRETALQAMNTEQAELARKVTNIALQRLLKMMAFDDEQLAEWQTDTRTLREARAGAIERQDYDGAATIKLPTRPRPLVSAYSLVALSQMGLDRERVARVAAIEQTPVEAQGALPQVVVVNQVGAPPPEPVDPYEDAVESDGPAHPSQTSHSPLALAPAMVGLASQPPDDLPDDVAAGWSEGSDDLDGDDDDDLDTPRGLSGPSRPRGGFPRGGRGPGRRGGR